MTGAETTMRSDVLWFGSAFLLLFLAALVPPRAWKALLRALRTVPGLLGATVRYLVTSHKGACPGCERARARAKRSHPAARAVRIRPVGISDEKRFEALTGVPWPRDGSDR